MLLYFPSGIPLKLNNMKIKRSHSYNPSWQTFAPGRICNKQTDDDNVLPLFPHFLFGLCAGQGPTSPAAASGSPLSSPAPPASPTSTAATPAPEPGFGVGSEAPPVAEPKQLARPSRSASGRRDGSSGQRLEPALPTRDPGTVDALQGFLSQDDASSYSTSNR